MLKSKFCFSFLWVLLLFPSSEVVSQVLISYEKFMDDVMKFHPLSDRAENFKKLGMYQLQAARGSYDPFLEGNHENKFYNGTNYYSVSSAQLKQALFTSQYLKAGYDYGYGNYINPELKTSTAGIPYLGMEVSLLQGLVIDKRRAEVLKSRAYLNYYTAEQKNQLNQLFFESSQQYFDWLFSLKQISLNAYFLQLAQQRYTGIESLAEVGERPAVDTVEASLFIQSRLLDLQNAELDKIKSQNQLASFNWNENGNASLQYSFIPSDSLDAYFEKAKQVIGKLMFQDSLSNPIISKYTAFQEVLNVDKRLKREFIKPKLNVNYNLLAGNTNASSPIFTTNSYKWGLSFSMPLLLRTPVNEYRMADISSKNNSLELSSKNNELMYKLNQASQSISVLSQQLLNAQKSVDYSRKLVDAEKQKFEAGESSLFLINTRESKWLESELKLAEYKLKFIKSTLQIIYLKGNLNYVF